MAAVQATTTAIALIVVLASSFFIVAKVVDRVRDRALMNVATATVTGLSELPEGAGEKRIARELDQHRPAGVRVEAIDQGGQSVAAAGEGPRLRSQSDDACGDQDGWRVCERSVGNLQVLVGRSRREDDATNQRLFTVLALVSAAALLVGGVVSRVLAARGLAPLAAISRRLGTLRPGHGERLSLRGGIAEVDELASHFDELLGRVDEAVTRERRFAAQASHELRTPLTVLRGELEVLAADEGPSQNGARRALASAESLVRLVESLLVFARAESAFDPADLEVVNLGDVVRREAETLTRVHGVGAERLVLDAPDETLVLGHEGLLARAVSNLIDNGLAHSPAETTVKVSVSEGDGRAIVRVVNQGEGVPASLRERVFEPFFREPRARAARPGHGLGLPLARAVARAHHGDVTLVEATSGETVFELGLPLARPQP
jgi:signal transduction histidine kinase